MTDGELRGVVLRKFYDVRHQQDWIGPPVDPSADRDERIRIFNICEQLAQSGLIEWRPIKPLSGDPVGMGKINAFGVDVIEGNLRPPIAITLHDRRISVTGSTNVQIGDANTQGVSIEISKLTAAVDHSTASEADKKEAKSLLEKISTNPLLIGIFKRFFSGS
jgi:hypothetical protein